MYAIDRKILECVLEVRSISLLSLDYHNESIREINSLESLQDDMKVNKQYSVVSTAKALAAYNLWIVLQHDLTELKTALSDDVGSHHVGDDCTSELLPEEQYDIAVDVLKTDIDRAIDDARDADSFKLLYVVTRDWLSSVEDIVVGGSDRIDKMLRENGDLVESIRDSIISSNDTADDADSVDASFL